MTQKRTPKKRDSAIGDEKPGEVVKRSPWKNRIIGSDIVDPKSLQPNELNWRKHPKPQADALNGALDSIGWIQDIIVNKQTGRMIDGHLRVELALKNKETEVPVKYVDLTPAEEELALLTLDPIGAMAEADKNLLEALLNTVKTDDERIKGLMDSIGQDYIITEYIPHDTDAQKAGASPWERMNGESSDGVLFTFGAITCRIDTDIYNAFLDGVASKPDIAGEITEIIKNAY